MDKRAGSTGNPKIRIYTFPSQSRGHIVTGVKHGCWAVRDNDMPDLPSKASRIRPGDLGIFYCSRRAWSDGYLCHPFCFKCTPSDEEAERIQHLWEGGPWRLGFRFAPIGSGKGHVDEDMIKTLRTLRESTKTWQTALRLSPVCAFNPAEIYAEDWERIVHACSSERGIR